jgi:hypothetical protein
MGKKRNHVWLSGIAGVLIGTSVFASIPQASGDATHNEQAALYASWPVIHTHGAMASQSELAMLRRVIAAAQAAFHRSAEGRSR